MRCCWRRCWRPARCWCARLTACASDEPLQEVLYIPSPTVVKRMSLGYSGLLADIYWTRVVQYFGAKHKAKAKQYLILANPCWR